MVTRAQWFDGFRREIERGAGDRLAASAIAAALCGHLARLRQEVGAPIAEIRHWSLNVELTLDSGAMWTIECIGPNAYRVYPAYIRSDGSVLWLNVWVADDLTLDAMIDRVLNDVLI